MGLKQTREAILSGGDGQIIPFNEWVADGENINMHNAAGTVGQPVHYSYQCPEDHACCIQQMCLTLVALAMQWGQFGGAAALENGMLLRVMNADFSEVVLDLVGEEGIRQNSDWHAHVGPAATMNIEPGNDALAVRWQFGFSFGEPIQIQAGQHLAVTFQDTISATRLRMRLHGYLVNLAYHG